MQYVPDEEVIGGTEQELLLNNGSVKKMQYLKEIWTRTGSVRFLGIGRILGHSLGTRWAQG